MVDICCSFLLKKVSLERWDQIRGRVDFHHRFRHRPPRLRTDMRAESARRVYSPRRGYGYPNVPALSRARSQDRFSRATKASGSEDDQEAAAGRVRVAIQQNELWAIFQAIF